MNKKRAENIPESNICFQRKKKRAHIHVPCMVPLVDYCQVPVQNTNTTCKIQNISST